MVPIGHEGSLVKVLVGPIRPGELKKLLESSPARHKAIHTKIAAKECNINLKARTMAADVLKRRIRERQWHQAQKQRSGRARKRNQQGEKASYKVQGSKRIILDF